MSSLLLICGWVSFTKKRQLFGLLGLGVSGQTLGACVIGVKCYGKELISSIIIIYGSLCVHLPQNIQVPVCIIERLCFSRFSLSPSLCLCAPFCSVCLIIITVLIGVWVGTTQKKICVSHFEFLFLIFFSRRCS